MSEPDVPQSCSCTQVMTSTLECTEQPAMTHSAKVEPLDLVPVGIRHHTTLSLRDTLLQTDNPPDPSRHPQARLLQLAGDAGRLGTREVDDGRATIRQTCGDVETDSATDGPAESDERAREQVSVESPPDGKNVDRDADGGEQVATSPKKSQTSFEKAVSTSSVVDAELKDSNMPCTMHVHNMLLNPLAKKIKLTIRKRPNDSEPLESSSQQHLTLPKKRVVISSRPAPQHVSPIPTEGYVVTRSTGKRHSLVSDEPPQPPKSASRPEPPRVHLDALESPSGPKRRSLDKDRARPTGESNATLPRKTAPTVTPTPSGSSGNISSTVPSATPPTAIPKPPITPETLSMMANLIPPTPISSPPRVAPSSSSSSSTSSRPRRISSSSKSSESTDPISLNALCLNLVLELMENEAAWPFNRPVDPVKEGVLDYLTIIKKPMDLRTIRDGLKKKTIPTFSHFVDSVELVWSNAFTYNPEGTLVRKHAETMQREWGGRRNTLRGLIVRSKCVVDDQSISFDPEVDAAPPSDVASTHYELRSTPNHVVGRETRSALKCGASRSTPTNHIVLKRAARQIPATDPRLLECEARVKQLRETLKKTEQTLARVRKSGLNQAVHALMSAAQTNRNDVETRTRTQRMPDAKSMTWQEKRMLVKVMQSLTGPHVAAIVAMIEEEAPDWIPEIGSELTFDLDLSTPSLLRRVEAYIREHVNSGQRWLDGLAERFEPPPARPTTEENPSPTSRETTSAPAERPAHDARADARTVQLDDATSSSSDDSDDSGSSDSDTEDSDDASLASSFLMPTRDDPRSLDPPKLVPVSPSPKQPLVLQNVDSWFMLDTHPPLLSPPSPAHTPLSFSLPEPPGRSSFLDKSIPNDDALWSQLCMRNMLNKQRLRERLELEEKQRRELEERERRALLLDDQRRLELECAKHQHQAVVDAEKQRQELELKQRREHERQMREAARFNVETLNMMEQSTVMMSFEKEMNNDSHRHPRYTNT